MHSGLTILMYHRVLPLEQCVQYPLESLAIPVEAFRQQMRLLASRCRVLPVHAALAELERGCQTDRPLVAVTFDDGYADNVEAATPILEQNGLRGTFFITTGFVEKGQPLWFDRAADVWHRLPAVVQKTLMAKLYGEVEKSRHHGEKNLAVGTWMAALKRAEPDVRMEVIHQAEFKAGGVFDSRKYRPMTPEQVSALYNRGHEVASHTVTHPMLLQLNEDSLQDELYNSREKLGKWTGDEISGLCYPNGDFDDRVELFAERAGYRYGCTMRAGLNKPGVNTMRLARLFITMQRTTVAGCWPDPLGFRAELCRFREWWR